MFLFYSATVIVESGEAVEVFLFISSSDFESSSLIVFLPQVVSTCVYVYCVYVSSVIRRKKSVQSDDQDV